MNIKNFALLLALFYVATAMGNSPIIWGPGRAKNLTNILESDSGHEIISGALDPSSVAVSANAGSIYQSSSGTVYVKQDNGSSTNWLPIGVAAPSSLSTINGQSGPAVSLITGTAGTDFGISASGNNITFDLPTASASNRGLLSSSNWSTFNSKEPAVTATTSADYYRGDKTFQPLNKAAVGLSNVDDTDDASKPVSTAQQAALDLKEDLITATTSADYYRGDKTFQPLNKTAVGLPNVDDTSDANKPVSTAQQTALDLKANLASPALTGNPTAPTAAPGDDDTSIATTEFVTDAVAGSSDPSKVSGPASSVNNEIALFDSTTGKLIKSATGTGFVKATAGVYSTSTNANISGKGQESSAVTVDQIQLPYNQLTQTGSGEFLAETGNTNLLVNPSFDSSSSVADGWSGGGGVATAYETSVVVHGKKSLKITMTAGTLVFDQDSTIHAAQFADGVQGVASIRIKTAVSGISVCPRRAGVTLTSPCATVNSDNKWMLYKVPFVFGGTSNGISIASSGAVTGDIYLDDAYLGTDAGIADVSVVTPWQSYTPTFTGFGTVTVSSCFHRQVGSNREIDCRFVNGTQTAVEARVSLPAGDVSVGAISTIQIAGTAGRSTSSSAPYLAMIEPNVSYLTFSNGASNVGTKLTGSGFVGAGETVYIKASVPVANLSGSTQVFSSQCGASCVDRLVAKVSTAGAVSDLNVPGWVTCGTFSSGQITCTYAANTFSVTPSCTLKAVGAAGGTTTARADQIVTQSASAITMYFINDGGSTFSSAFNLECTRAGVDANLSRNITGSFKEVPKYPGINNPKTCSAVYGGVGATLTSPVNCTTGTCIEIYDGCGTFSPPAFSSTGNVTNATFAAGTWANSTSLDCDCRAWDTGGNGLDCRFVYAGADDDIASSSSGGWVVDVNSSSANGTVVNAFTRLTCTGSAP